jgi:hypothetical protein
LPGTLPGPAGDRDLRSHEAFTADNVPTAAGRRDG